MIAAAPAPDKPLLDSVTEHFAAARPGTVPRIPASLFLQVDSPAGDEETHFCHKSPSVSPLASSFIVGALYVIVIV